jgi:hypothetical protein
MPITLGVLAPLALAASPVETLSRSDVEDASSRFADVLTTSYVCDVLGYAVDYPGLASLGYATQDLMIDAGYDADEAMERIRNDVEWKRERFHRYHGQSIMRGVYLASAPSGFGDEAMFRLMKTFRGRCNDLASSLDAGPFIEKPDDRMNGLEVRLELQRRGAMTPP